MKSDEDGRLLAFLSEQAVLEHDLLSERGLLCIFSTLYKPAEGLPANKVSEVGFRSPLPLMLLWQSLVFERTHCWVWLLYRSFVWSSISTKL